MEARHLTLLALLAFVLPLNALERRTFFSQDKKKSFVATLYAFNEKAQTVTVTTKNGGTKSFPLKLLSEECRAYVQSKKDLLYVAKSVKLSISEEKDPKVGKGIPTYFNISVANRGARVLEDVTLKYTLYYRRGSIDEATTELMTQDGELSTGKLYKSDTMLLSTAKIDIVRDSRRPSGGG